MNMNEIPTNYACYGYIDRWWGNKPASDECINLSNNQ